jgi:YGGT family
MTYERRVTTRTEEDPAYVPATPATATRSGTVVERTDVSPSGGEMLRRIVVLIFGIIQALIILRIVLLLLDAREGNPIVSFILDTSQLFVAPFIGIFQTDALRQSGSVLDIAAIAALVGWTILEFIILWAVNLFRREPV